MTFTGTRSYIVGEGEVALIDPGPDDPAHHAALMAALAPGERITHILVTHTHCDHSPLATTMARETGAMLYGFGPHGSGMQPRMRALVDTGADLGGGEGADRRFRPERALEDGQTVAGRGWALTALHTPGHLSNHLCFVLEDTGVVFSGDHVMGWASTLISPPEGDLTDFMSALRRLRARAGDRLYLPGHGAPVTEPHRLVDHIIAHREGRERQILAALAEAADTITGLTARIYADIDPKLHPAAARNVLAHLVDLVERGEVAAEDGLSRTGRF
ncbi:MAG: MBL fold metallo-hydrolase, partial [Alphaproteobacteria bacterium]